ncbi:MAG TPA: hypothetical protein VFW28_10270 [Micropepsaceae bacterium]|nr:hypothetical protein [Micropepsaceae bacterium]
MEDTNRPAASRRRSTEAEHAVLSDLLRQWPPHERERDRTPAEHPQTLCGFPITETGPGRRP